jgi:hypothetical protein
LSPHVMQSRQHWWRLEYCVMKSKVDFWGSCYTRRDADSNWVWALEVTLSVLLIPPRLNPSLTLCGDRPLLVSGSTSQFGGGWIRALTSSARTALIRIHFDLLMTFCPG